MPAVARRITFTGTMPRALADFCARQQRLHCDADPSMKRTADLGAYFAQGMERIMVSFDEERAAHFAGELLALRARCPETLARAEQAVLRRHVRGEVSPSYRLTDLVQEVLEEHLDRSEGLLTLRGQEAAAVRRCALAHGISAEEAIARLLGNLSPQAF